MPRMLDVSDEVRNEIGDDEADALLAGAHAPDTYDCTSCRTSGDSTREATSTVLFVGDETAVLAFAHARCIPSQVVPVSEEQLQGAVRSISQSQTAPAPTAPAVPAPAAAPAAETAPAAAPAAGQPAILGITCGLVLREGAQYAALVVEPTGPVGRPGDLSGEDQFLSLLGDHGFQPVPSVDADPAAMPGWSVLLAMGQLHAILHPGAKGGSAAWWQAHQPLQVTDNWRSTARQHNAVMVYAAPAGTIGRQPREDLLRAALDRAAHQGLLVAAALPLAGT
ncbi:hypothetical protein CFP65_5693 [Kitasatospora sp. MMS16-BH015]|uniref:hypothetical protein n=1 Tax=Kitasatospora sp. MMS16-BH015 TaxID=2018025 RepID=UPI000CA20A67|nr:hypothetical protein [Kitasatospora sp. MMS16-BH015]AUG80387.1 hypothetical protein CFP65_5693 [Kitasatospora sp. MMS16-BH015]